MKLLYTTILVILANLPSHAQFIRVNNSLSSGHINSFLNNDTLSIYTYSDTNVMYLYNIQGTEKLMQHDFYLNSKIPTQQSTKLLKDSFSSSHILEINAAQRTFLIGNQFIYDTTTASIKSTIWIKEDSISSFDQLENIPLLDSSYQGIYIITHKVIDNYLYLFGGLKVDYYPYNKSYIIKYNLTNKQFQLKYYNCFAAFCNFHDMLYDSLNANFIVISPYRLSDTLTPYSTRVGIAKIDTNLNLIPNSAQTLETNLVLPISQAPAIGYRIRASIEPINDSSFIIAGEISNPQDILSIWNLRPHEWDDIGVGIRSMSTLQEIMQPKIYGKPDTSEAQLGKETIFKKIENNFYITANSERLDGGSVYQPWNTSLALHALNDRGELHWEYYFTYGDYCWAQEIIMDENGGLWVTAQCSDNFDPNTGSFSNFIKVAYIDSVAFWPRIGGSVGINEFHKKAEELSIYPNPSSDILNIKQDGLIQQLQFRMMDLNGRVVLESQNRAHYNQLNIENLTSGMYILNILNEDGSFIKSEKVIKH